MPYCAKCSHSFVGKQCPLCGGPPVLTPKQVNEALKNYAWLILGGLGGALLVTYRFPLLDMNPALMICLLVFLAPILTHLILALRKQASSRLEILRRTYKWAGVALVGITVMLFLNGALDRFPSTEVRSFVTRKSASHGRGGPSYNLTVSPSWRPGREDERLRVSGATFSSVHTGEAVLIEVHRGTFGLPWFSRVTPQ